MKNLLCFFLFVMLLAGPPSFAQSPNDVLTVMHLDGTMTSLPIEEIRLITFPDDYQMRVSMKNETKDFSVAMVRKMMVSFSTGLNDPEPPLQQQVKLYPNPVVDDLFVQYEHPEAASFQIRIFDLNGKMVLSRTVSSQAMSTGTSLQVSHLVPGLYLFLLQTEGYNFSSKIIK